jgi:hypothetical protein
MLLTFKHSGYLRSTRFNITKILHSIQRLYFYEFLGALAKLRKATIGFAKSVCLPVCLSVRPSACIQQLTSHWTDFHEI